MSHDSSNYILGISAFYHDSAACVLKDGSIIAAAQEERFTRIKHDESFPENAIQYCLTEAGIDATEIDYVVYYEKPLLKFDRLLETYLAYAPRGFTSFRKAIPLWLKKKIFMERQIRTGALEDYKGPIVYPEHHESHAASAFLPSPFESAAVLTVDGVGEWATTTISRGKGNKIEMLEQINFPHSLGLFYSAFTYFCGFKVNSGEYKLMGLAPYGDPKYVDIIKKNLIEINDDGSYRLNLKYFEYPVGLKMTNQRFSDLFGIPPRSPEIDISQVYMDLAASVQKVIEEIILLMAKHVKELTGESNLCLAGGVALNCVSNGNLARAGIFENIWVQPASGDAGGSLGAALFTWHQLLGKEREVVEGDSQSGSLLGPEFDAESARTVLESEGAVFEEYDDLSTQAEAIANLINTENVVGLHHGRMEFGPRALGGRSILGDPRSPKMQQTLNLKIKFRESFRPFAPSVLVGGASEYFDMGVAKDSPYMLLVAPVKEEKRLDCQSEMQDSEGLKKLGVARSEVPAITHVDFSARVQTVDPERNPFYYQIIQQFYEKTGCPMVINTSFNIRGEPIVCTPADAYRCFMGTHMDAVSIGPFILKKKDQPQANLDKAKPYLESFQLD